MLASNSALAGGPKAIACPQVLKTVVDQRLFKDWSIYSNDPLHLTGAWVKDNSIPPNHLEGVLDPDSAIELNDDKLSVQSAYRLPHARDRQLLLQCNYGVHAHLAKALPKTIAQCVFVKHRRIYDWIEFTSPIPTFMHGSRQLPAKFLTQFRNFSMSKKIVRGVTA